MRYQFRLVIQHRIKNVKRFAGYCIIKVLIMHQNMAVIHKSLITFEENIEKYGSLKSKI